MLVDEEDKMDKRLVDDILDHLLTAGTTITNCWNITEKEVNRYLASIARNSKTPSLSDFKFYVNGLRYCYRLLGMNGLDVTQKKDKKDWKQICREHLGYDPDQCPHCKKGKMVTIDMDSLSYCRQPQCGFYLLFLFFFLYCLQVW